jgi:hypothetical protein
VNGFSVRAKVLHRLRRSGRFRVSRTQIRINLFCINLRSYKIQYYFKTIIIIRIFDFAKL